MEGKATFCFCSPTLCGWGRMGPCRALAARAHAHSVCCPGHRRHSGPASPVAYAVAPGPPLAPRPEAPALPSSPSLSCHVWIRPGSLPEDPVLLPAPRSRAFPPEVSPARSDQKPARERAQEPSVWTVSVYYHVDTDGAGRARPPRQDAGEGLRVDAPPPATAGPRHREEPPKEARDLGRLLYKPKEMYT